jgi:uncharacterized protein (DUF1684 family)
MKRILVLYALLIFTLTGCGKSPARGPVKLDKTAEDAITMEIEKDRAETREWLRSNPRSYLAAIDRIDFGTKSALTVGRADDNDVRLSAADIEPHHLQVTVIGDRFHVEALDAKAGFKVKDEVKRDAMLDPSTIQIGRFHLRLSHQRYPAIIVFDPQSPRMKEYKGLEYFPVDLSYRYELPLTRIPIPEKIVILSTRGNRRSAERVGWLDFLVGKTPCRLEATHLLEPGSGADDLSVFFRDATSGKETYQLGRYVDVKKLPNGNYLLDFNTAYNPACAFSNYYNCPVPPKANTLTAAIRAGEKDSHYH